MPDNNDVTDAAIDVYDRIAACFDLHVRSSAHNAYYERPAMLALLPDVHGRMVLDAGCGSGAYAEILVSRGAKVVALDASKEMVALTRTKLNGSIPVHHHDLREPAPFLESGSFDVVLCPLVLDHLLNLDPVFSEFHRVLTTKGVVVFSMVHPLNDYPRRGKDYYKVEAISPRLSAFGVELPSYRRPLVKSHFQLKQSQARVNVSARHRELFNTELGLYGLPEHRQMTVTFDPTQMWFDVEQCRGYPTVAL